MADVATRAPDEVRSKLALVLDLDDVVPAVRLARELQPWFGTVKVGLELYTATGPDVVGMMTELGLDVFCDLKMHDIPTTVGRAARVVGSLGARYLNFHASGGVTMLRAGVEGFRTGAAEAGLDDPVPLAVTVLTSDADAPGHVLGKRVAVAIEAGCGGVVCAAEDLRQVRELAPRFVTVVPGIRLAGGPTHDQARHATPQEALAAGADLLVIGRAITEADDPAKAAALLVESLTSGA
jgi:orotidine-5'-phosphate decarboxylase